MPDFVTREGIIQLWLESIGCKAGVGRKSVPEFVMCCVAMWVSLCLYIVSLVLSFFRRIFCII